jgi:hypothetical protein
MMNAQHTNFLHRSGNSMMRRTFVPFVIAACATPLFSSSSAHAQAAELATRLLEEAKRANDAGNLAAACPLLDRAYQMDAKDGLLFARADCRDREGKIVAAVSLYEEYLRAYTRMTGLQKQSHAQRANIAQARAIELGPLVPMIQFVWGGPPPANAKIIIDGIEFPAVTLDDKLPLETGPHDIIVTLPGKPDHKQTVTLSKGDSSTVDLTSLVDKQSGSVKGPQRIGLKAQKKGVDPWKVGGFVGIGLGVAGIVAGSVTGKLAIDKKEIVDAHCNGDHRCNDTGLAAAESFQTMGNISTATFIAGGVLASVGATLLVVAYRGSGGGKTTAQVRTTMGPGSAQIAIEGAF